MSNEKGPPFNEIRSNLWNEASMTKGEYSTYGVALLDQYKLYVELADRVSHRRSMANTYFLSVNSLLAIIASGFWATSSNFPTFFLVFALVVLEGLCLAWFYIVRSYRQLNTAKWAVIGALEERLPASPWWRGEWVALGKGEDYSLYWPLTHLEQWIPILFALLYLGAFVAALIV